MLCGIWCYAWTVTRQLLQHGTTQKKGVGINTKDSPYQATQLMTCRQDVEILNLRQRRCEEPGQGPRRAKIYPPAQSACRCWDLDARSCLEEHRSGSRLVRSQGLSIVQIGAGRWRGRSGLLGFTALLHGERREKERMAWWQRDISAPGILAPKVCPASQPQVSVCSPPRSPCWFLHSPPSWLLLAHAGSVVSTGSSGLLAIDRLLPGSLVSWHWLKPAPICIVMPATVL